MPYIDRDGVKIYYECAGSGPTVLLSHGYSSSTRMWEGQVAAFSPSYQVITWDMALKSKEDLSPPKYEWGEIASPPVAIPGVTRFI